MEFSVTLLLIYPWWRRNFIRRIWGIREVKRIGTRFIASKIHLSGIEFLPFRYELTTADSFLQCHTWGRLAN